MGRQRGEEFWVAAMVRAALGGVVLHHDDGSRDGMYDLRLPSDSGDGAMEVVAAADAESIAFWNLMNGRDRRWVEEGLDGGWLVVVDPGARVHRLRKELPSLLAALEGAGVAHMRITRHAPLGVDRLAAELGLHSAHQSGTDFTGSIYVTVERDPKFTGGAVAATGDLLAAWLGEFLNSASCADVRRKLHTSGLDERHAFVLLPGFTTAPFVVADLLMRNDAPLPSVAPLMPREVTHVWAASTWNSGSGMRWSPSGGWSRFDKVVP